MDRTGTDIVQRMILCTHDRITALQALMQSGQILCDLKVGKVDDSDTIDYVKSLNAYSIDWSDMPDYRTSSEFMSITKAAGSETTLHTCQFSSWK